VSRTQVPLSICSRASRFQVACLPVLTGAFVLALLDGLSSEDGNESERDCFALEGTRAPTSVECEVFISCVTCNWEWEGVLDIVVWDEWKGLHEACDEEATRETGVVVGSV